MRRLSSVIMFVSMGLCLAISSGCQQTTAVSQPEPKAPLAVEPEPQQKVEPKPALQPLRGQPLRGQPPKVEPEPAPQPPKTQPKPAADVNKSAPTVTFQETVYNFGEIGVQESVNCEFKFKNTGYAPLKISKVRRTCGCTVPTLDKTDYQPGEEGVITVKYTGQSAPGSVSKNVYVISNDPKNPKLRLSIRGKTLRFVEARPAHPTFTLIKEVAAPTITLTSKDGKDFAVTGFTSNSDAVSISFDPNISGQEFTFQPQVDRGKISTTQRGVLKFQLTHPRCSSLSVFYKVVSKFQARPSRIMLHNVQASVSQTKDLVISSMGNEPFEIEFVSSQKGHVTLLSQQSDENNTVRLKLKITPPVQQGKQRHFSDTLTVKIKGEEDLVVSCSGFYRRPVAAKKRAS